ncbi:MAG TPA: GAF domain-containing protein, partial [Kofleriaceae bacterium]
MTDRGNGPWDAPTEHDDQRDIDAEMSGEDPPTVRASDGERAKARGAAIANSLATGNPATKPPSTTLPPPPIQRLPAQPITTPSDDVVVLDRVSGNMPIEHAPRRSESAAGGVVVVATGPDTDRVRKLCHKHGLLVPVMTSLAVVHDAMSVVVIGEPSPPAPERVVHVVRPTLADAKLLDLLRALVTGHVVVEPPRAPTAIPPNVADAARRLASLTDRGAIETTAIEAVTALTTAERAHCLFHEPVSGALWSETRRRAGGDDRAAMGGLVGWAAQTGQPIHASPAGDDPRWLQELDDPDGKPQSRLLVQPIIGGDRRVHAVLVAVRRWRHADFSDAEVTALASLAALTAPALDLAVAASPAEPRKRTTMPRVAASAASTLAPPRTGSDSRPPPVTAGSHKAGDSLTPGRRTAGDHTAPVPMTGRAPAVNIVPIVEEPTKVDERYSSESITS